MILPVAFTKFIGAAAGFCFAYCGVPIAWKTYRAGKSLGTPVVTAIGICLGTLLAWFYLFFTYGLDVLLTINYTVEFLSWFIVIIYHYKGKR